jgi:hypothetical protein
MGLGLLQGFKHQVKVADDLGGAAPAHLLATVGQAGAAAWLAHMVRAHPNQKGLRAGKAHGNGHLGAQQLGHDLAGIECRLDIDHAVGSTGIGRAQPDGIARAADAHTVAADGGKGDVGQLTARKRYDVVAVWVALARGHGVPLRCGPLGPARPGTQA